ncbi:MAG: LysM peptidoglycan-binding domain-containing protein [Bacteroidota bacterium]
MKGIIGQVNPLLKRTGLALLTLAILQLACYGTPALWGTSLTPTPVLPAAPPTQDPFLPPPPVTAPTLALTPTITPTPIGSFSASTPTSGPNPFDMTSRATNVPSIMYYSKSGDTLEALARRFGVSVAELNPRGDLAAKGLLEPNTVLFIPDRLPAAMTPDVEIMPDTEVIYSTTAVGFDIKSYIDEANGFLKGYREYLGSTGWVYSDEAFRRLSLENSINPRLLLALLEYESRWVRGAPVDSLHRDYPMGYEDYRYKGMFPQMVWAINQLSIGYYGWRAGTVTELSFIDGTRLRLDPRLNAGTVAIQYLFSKLHSQSQWSQIIDPNSGFPAMYAEMFGDPWARADRVPPIFGARIPLPTLELPFDSSVEWSYTGGPHGAWEHDGSLAAIDFAPATDHGGCAITDTWVTAAAAGRVVRSEQGVVVVDLDSDGFESTGWDLLYLHIAAKDRVPVDTLLNVNDRIGHASCEGGIATGTHLHFARKYNGEWVAADGPIPMVLSGWTVVAGAKPYEGMLVKGDRTIIADPVGQAWSVIFRDFNVSSTPVGP